MTTISTTETSETTYYALEFLYSDTGVAQSQRGTDGELVHFSGYVTLVSSTNTKPIPTPVSFRDDSWATIAVNVQENKEETKSVYAVGNIKWVKIDGIDYKVIIVNNSNYDCTLDSKTACGFVVGFEDIVEQRAMNSTDTNVGGWPATAMYKYLNGDTDDHLTYNDSTNGTTATLFSKLPSDLRNVIIDTTAISGHGSIDNNSERDDGNWESTDKIYLTSTGEIWSDCTTGDNCRDTASYPHNGNGTITTRQLDYYLKYGVTTPQSYALQTIKKYRGNAAGWWVRASLPGNDIQFNYVSNGGNNNYANASYTSGGALPAFRIG